MARLPAITERLQNDEASNYSGSKKLGHHARSFTEMRGLGAKSVPAKEQDRDSEYSDDGQNAKLRQKSGQQRTTVKSGPAKKKRRPPLQKTARQKAPHQSRHDQGYDDPSMRTPFSPEGAGHATQRIGNRHTYIKQRPRDQSPQSKMVKKEELQDHDIMKVYQKMSKSSAHFDFSSNEHGRANLNNTQQLHNMSNYYTSRNHEQDFGHHGVSIGTNYEPPNDSFFGQYHQGSRTTKRG